MKCFLLIFRVCHGIYPLLLSPRPLGLPVRKPMGRKQMTPPLLKSLQKTTNSSCPIKLDSREEWIWRESRCVLMWGWNDTVQGQFELRDIVHVAVMPLQVPCYKERICIWQWTDSFCPVVICILRSRYNQAPWTIFCPFSQFCVFLLLPLIHILGALSINGFFASLTVEKKKWHNAWSPEHK